MKLYPKQLNSIEELEREKLLLKYARKHANPSDLFSVDQLFGKKSSKDKPEGNSSIFGGLGKSGIYLDLAYKYLLPLLRRKNKKLRVEEAIRKAPSNILKKLASEVLFGYVKWKLIELSYKGIASYIRSRKEKKLNITK